MASFTSVLKTVGKRVGQIIGFTAPLVNQLIGPGRVGDVFNSVTGIIQAVEGMFESAYPDQKTGPAKLLAVLPFVSTIIRNSEMMLDKDIVDEALFMEGTKDIVNGSVKVLNACKHLDRNALADRLKERGVDPNMAAQIAGNILTSNTGKMLAIPGGPPPSR